MSSFFIDVRRGVVISMMTAFLLRHSFEISSSSFGLLVNLRKSSASLLLIAIIWPIGVSINAELSCVLSIALFFIFNSLFGIHIFV